MISAPPAPAPKSLPRSHALGRRAEQVVADYLEAQGFVVLERNLRVGHLEIDLLVRRDDLIAVVEVRCRSPQAWQGPFQSVSAAKRQRLRRAGTIVWQRRFANDLSVSRMRFDVAAVHFTAEGEAVVEYAKAVL